MAYHASDAELLAGALGLVFGLLAAGVGFAVLTKRIPLPLLADSPPPQYSFNPVWPPVTSRFY